MKIPQLVLVVSVLTLLGGKMELHAADDGLSALLNAVPAVNTAETSAAPPTQPAAVSPGQVLSVASPVVQQPGAAQTANASAPQDSLARVNSAIGLYPNNPAIYIVRGNIYSEKKKWDAARKDYQKALALDPRNAAAQVNLAELDFRLKQYDQARTAFLAIEGDKSMGDLASYMVFLCDLYSAHDAAAGQELAVFNAAGVNASYYFGNIAWDLFHRNVDGARDYLHSAQAIYPPGKLNLYESNLIESGYLPLKE